MTAEMDLVVAADGVARCIYDETLDLRELGNLQITRASHVEPDAEGNWWADMGPVDGPVRGSLGMDRKSPFDGLRPGSQANPARARYVPVETIRDVLDHCPSVEWKFVVGLARYAGLRCPSEIGAVTWDHVNWEKGRLTVLAKKTEHHGGDHAVRVVPICPELRALLDEAFELAEPGETLVAPMAGRKGANLRAQMNRIITKSGHEPWPRLMQNLRASCGTDWVERFPSHVVAKWLGHSPKVAAQHYLMSREHHFESVVTGGSPVEATTTLPFPARGQEERTESPTEPKAAAPMKGNGAEIAVSECDANCDAPATHFATQQASAPDPTESHETAEPAAATRVTAGSSKRAPVTETGPRHDAAQKISRQGPWMALPA